jgi:bifunctional non-homologous end joining protein LigD
VQIDSEESQRVEEALHGEGEGLPPEEEQEAAGIYFGPKPPEEKGHKVVLEGHELVLGNLGKVFWPEDGTTKQDLVDYYLGMAPWILPYLKDRPESMNRHPNGIAGDSFFHKDLKFQEYPWLKIFRFESKKKEGVRYLVCNDKATLIYLVNLGCIEMNPWSSRIQT